MKIYCKCGNSKKADLKDYDIPAGAVRMCCNYCLKCEDESNEDCYDEWFEDSNGGEVINYF